MKTTKYALLAALVVVPLVGASGAAYARWGRAGNSDRAERFIKWQINDMLSEIDASDEQSAEVNAVLDDLIAKAKPIIEEHRSTRGEFRDMVLTDEPDRDALHRLIDERSSRFVKLMHEAADAALNVNETLSSEQREELREVLPRPRH
ncbi:MAG: periplasmic heavy metal sensor [Myxococcota bacterium]